MMSVKGILESETDPSKVIAVGLVLKLLELKVVIISLVSYSWVVGLAG